MSSIVSRFFLKYNHQNYIHGKKRPKQNPSTKPQLNHLLQFKLKYDLPNEIPKTNFLTHIKIKTN